MEIHITSILDIFCSNLWTTFVGGYHANDCMKRATMISGSFVVNWCKSYQIWVWLKTLAPGWFFWLVDGCWFSHVIGFDPSPSGTFSCWETMSNGLRCTWGQLPAVFFFPGVQPFCSRAANKWIKDKPKSRPEWLERQNQPKPILWDVQMFPV